MDIFKNTKKPGVHTNKIDSEPYFERWESCIPLGSKDQPELIGQPCYKHKTCGHLVKVPHNRIPPIVCTWCGKNTKVEELELQPMREAGIPIFDFPQTVVNLKKSTFNPKGIARYLRGR